MSSKKVSVVIPNYNYGRFMAETIESVLAQTYTNYEIIVVDDGSTDNSLEVATSFPVTVLSQPNQGVSAARNNGASVATGDYLFFLDSDDLLFPDTLQVMVDVLNGAPDDVGFIYGQAQYFGEKSHVFESCDFDAKKLAKENFILASVLMRKSVFDEVGGFDRGFDLREDWELFVRLWHKGYKGQFLERPIIRCRKHRPRKVVRSMSKRRKRLSELKLITQYPRFFSGWLFKKILKLSMSFFMNFRHFKVGLYGSTDNFEVIKS